MSVSAASGFCTVAAALGVRCPVAAPRESGNLCPPQPLNGTDGVERANQTTPANRTRMGCAMGTPRRGKTQGLAKRAGMLYLPGPEACRTSAGPTGHPCLSLRPPTRTRQPRRPEMACMAAAATDRPQSDQINATLVTRECFESGARHESMGDAYEPH